MPGPLCRLQQYINSCNPCSTRTDHEGDEVLNDLMTASFEPCLAWFLLDIDFEGSVQLNAALCVAMGL